MDPAPTRKRGRPVRASRAELRGRLRRPLRGLRPCWPLSRRGPGRRSSSRSGQSVGRAERRRDLACRPLAGAHRAVHVAVPDVGGLGAGPVDAARRVAEGLRVARSTHRPSAARRSSRATTPPRPSRARCTRPARSALDPKYVREAVQRAARCGSSGDMSDASVAWSPSKKPSSTPLRRPAGGCRTSRSMGSSRLTTKPEKPVFAPERLLVAELHLDDPAHGHLLSELVAAARERRAVADAAGERRGTRRSRRSPRRDRCRPRGQPRRPRRVWRIRCTGAASRTASPSCSASRSAAPGCRRRRGCSCAPPPVETSMSIMPPEWM